MALCWRIALWSALLRAALPSSPHRCAVDESGSTKSESPLLRSLQCYNDYMSHVHCHWRNETGKKLQLWFKSDKKREQCLPDTTQPATESETEQCSYKTKPFFIGIEHAAYFLEETTETLCSHGSRQKLELSKHLRAKPPVGLSFDDAGDRGWRLTWSSPYSSSSSLNKNITYEISYRKDGQSDWTTKGITTTSVKLEKQSLHSDCKYEARVRARVTVGQWSHWSPVLAFYTGEGAWQTPRLHCVLAAEKEVACSWEVSTEVAHFISYQLACLPHKTAPERCCNNPTASYDLGGRVFRYSCSLTVENPELLLLELQPVHNTKIFMVNRNIRPPPPVQVTGKKKASSWLVEWTAPPMPVDIKLLYELCYYRKQEQNCVVQSVPAGSTSYNILESSLAPSQDYQVKVRSLVAPGDNFSYEGIPSEWSHPADWTSREAAWAVHPIYFFIAMCVTGAFLVMYCTIPACQRKAILWVESVPSPAKSKILSEFKSPYSPTLAQCEITSMCKEQQLDSLSTCSSDASLWQNKGGERMYSDQDEGCWKCDNNPDCAEDPSTPQQSSSVSFSGPYIFCQPPETNSRSADEEREESEPPPDDPASPPPFDFNLYGAGYVCLPKGSASRSTQDLVSHSDANAPAPDRAEQDHPVTAEASAETDLQPGSVAPTSSPQLSAHASWPVAAGWPQGGTVESSGYFHLPAAPESAER